MGAFSLIVVINLLNRVMPSSDPASFVQPGADFTRITPVDQKITVTLINEYISNLVQKKTEHCAALISILDSKLDSIGVTSASSADVLSSPDNRETSVSMQAPLMSDEAPAVATNDEVDNELEHEEEDPSKPLFPPEYKRFVKMLKVGIHPLQVRMKLVGEGMDPDPIVTEDGVILINVQEVYDSIRDPPEDE